MCMSVIACIPGFLWVKYVTGTVGLFIALLSPAFILMLSLSPILGDSPSFMDEILEEGEAGQSIPLTNVILLYF